MDKIHHIAKQTFFNTNLFKFLCAESLDTPDPEKLTLLY